MATFLVNHNPGDDVIHDPTHLDERCNTDDAEDVERRVVLAEAAAAVAEGRARCCEWCLADGLPTDG